MSFKVNPVTGKLDYYEPFEEKVEIVSRTIFVETTGSDEAGDGTSTGTAFATLERAAADIANTINSCTITIQLGLGNFNVNAATAAAFKHITIVGSGTLKIKGTWVNEVTGISLSSTADPYVHNVNGATFAANSHVGHYAYRMDSIIVPIATHAENQIQTSYYSSSISKIISLGTTLVVSSSHNGNELSLNVRAVKAPSSRDEDYPIVKYEALDIQLSYFFYVNPPYNLTFGQCSFRQTGAMYVLAAASGTYDACYFNGNAHLFYMAGYGKQHVDVSGSVFHGGSSSSTFGAIYAYRTSLYQITNSIICNIGYGFTYNDYYSEIELGYNMKFDSVNVLCDIKSGRLLQNIGSTFYIDNVNYLINARGTRNIIIDVSNIFGTLAGGIFTTGSTVGKYLINPERNVQISAPGLFPNMEVGKSSSLTAGVITKIIVGDKTKNRAIVLDYVIERGSFFEDGQIRILYDGSILHIKQPPELKQDNSGGSGIGVTFNVNFDSVDTNLINLEVTLDSGDNAILKYDVERKML